MSYSAFCTAVEGCTERVIVVIRTIDGEVTAGLALTGITLLQI